MLISGFENKDFRNGFDEGYEKGRADMQEFVENRCKELGIDYTQIFTCEPAD